jgi:hypothetical protein
VKPDTFLLDGRAYSWRALCALRRQQVEAWRAARGEQPALFDLRIDVRPAGECTAAGRYLEPGLLDWARARTEHR